jgi:hypothetical protein
MNNELKVIMFKWLAITAFIIAFTVAILMMVPHSIFAQNGFDPNNNFNQPQQFNQQPQQFNDPNQFNNQFQQPQQFQQYPQQQFQQFPQYGMQTQYPQQFSQYPTNQSYGGLDIPTLISYIIGGTGTTLAYRTQKKNKELEELQKESMAVQLQDMRNQKDLARVVFSGQGQTVTDSPSIKLDQLDQNIQQFQQKAVKT